MFFRRVLPPVLNWGRPGADLAAFQNAEALHERALLAQDARFKKAILEICIEGGLSFDDIMRAMADKGMLDSGQTAFLDRLLNELLAAGKIYIQEEDEGNDPAGYYRSRKLLGLFWA